MKLTWRPISLSTLVGLVLMALGGSAGADGRIIVAGGCFAAGVLLTSVAVERKRISRHREVDARFRRLEERRRALDERRESS